MSAVSERLRKYLPYDGRPQPFMTEAADEIDRIEAKFKRLNEAVTELLRRSPLLQGCPHEGSVTGELVKKVLDAMK